MVNLNAFVIDLFCLILTAYTVAYAIEYDLTKKQQQHGDISVDSHVIPTPSSSPSPDLTVDSDEDAQKQKGFEVSTA
jgi:hypothetical protein